MIESPCNKVCVMNEATGLCRGCMRTIDEIVAWGTATDETKRAIWAEIRRREGEIDWQ